MQRFAAAILTAAWPLLFVPVANAQAEIPSAGPSQQAPDIPDQKLDAVASAMQQVASLRERYEQRLKKAPASDAPSIADEAKSTMAKAVMDQGLSVEEYNSILVMAQNNPEVRGKILQRMRPSEK
jgi:hypothetical protein